jgi:CHAT domain-containing protein
MELFLKAGSRPNIKCGLGLAYCQRAAEGDPRRSVESLLEALASVDKMRAWVLSMEHRIGLFEKTAVVFRALTEVLARMPGEGVALETIGVAPWVGDAAMPSEAWGAAFHVADRGKSRALEDELRERARLESGQGDVRLLAEDRGLSQRISKLASLREGLTSTNSDQQKKLTEQIDTLQQRRNQIEVEIKKTTLGSYVAPTYRKPLEMARDLPSSTAALEYSVGEKEAWLLLLTRAGVTVHRLGADAPALPELRPRQQASLTQLLEAWKERPDKLGLEGLVRLARARAEDLGKPERKHGLVNVALEQAILERLGGIVLPESAQADLKRLGIRHLLVVPDGPLHYLPLGMVRLKGAGNSTYLIEQYAVSSVPALATLEAIRKQKAEREQKRRGPRKELLAFANPDFGAGPVVKASDEMITRVRSIRSDYYASSGLKLTSLPEAELEAMTAASLFGSPREYRSPTADRPEELVAVYVGRAASEVQVKQLLGHSTLNSHPPTSSRYLLFGTHGLADERNGMLSCLFLSPTADSDQDGFLQAQEVLGLELDTDLVMLSACQTGLGQMHGGEGLVGLSASFFIAGAESVCVTLWSVPTPRDARLGPTGQIVAEFFKNLKEGKMDRAEALRQAQLTVLRHGRSLDGKPADYSSPFCWAAFVLLGEYQIGTLVVSSPGRPTSDSSK